MPKPDYGPLEEGVTRISQSSLNSFLKCSARYWMEQDGVRRTNVRMMVGSGVHVAAGKDAQKKADGEDPLKAKEFVEVAVEGYEAEQVDAEIPESRIEIAQGKDDTADAAKAYAEQVAPTILDVIEAEEPIITRVRDDLELVGTIDLTTVDGNGDLKVGKPWTADRANATRQLTIGGILHYARFGNYPSRVWIDSLGRSARKGWTHTRLWSTRTPVDYLSAMDAVDQARIAIQAGIELPAPEGAWWCGPKWCPFFDRCKYVGTRTA